MTETLHAVRLTVNGAVHDVELPARRLLSDALRHDLRLTGTHVGCEHGVCGACTVQLEGEPVRSCLMLAVQADGCSLRTIEASRSLLRETIQPLASRAFQIASPCSGPSGACPVPSSLAST